MTKNIDKAEIYNRITCQKCNKPVSKKRMADTMKRRFWPVCSECEKIITPKYREALEKMSKMGQGFG